MGMLRMVWDVDHGRLLDAWVRLKPGGFAERGARINVWGDNGHVRSELQWGLVRCVWVARQVGVQATWGAQSTWGG